MIALRKSSVLRNVLIYKVDSLHSFRPSLAPTSAQPKSIAVASDSTVFVAEIGTIEAFRSNQKVFSAKPSYSPSAVAAWQTTVAVGGEV